MKKIEPITIIKSVVIGIVIIGFISFFVSGYFESKRNYQKFINSSYKGVISKKKYFEGDMGTLSIMINSTWLPIVPYASKVESYINEGDSIVKKSGTKVIILYHKNKQGKWAERKFK